MPEILARRGASLEDDGPVPISEEEWQWVDEPSAGAAAGGRGAGEGGPRRVRCWRLRWFWQGGAAPAIRPGQPDPRWDTDLHLVPGIGLHRERALKRKGFETLRSLQSHPTWERRAARVEDALRRRDLRQLRVFGVPEVELLGAVDPSRVLFFDLETCGLAPVMPLFLIGALWWDGEAWTWRLEQCLARSFDEEPAVLGWFERLAGGFDALASYNGASFDLPFLRARLAANRWLQPSLPALHVDLLPVARRELRGVVADCRLTTVEAHLTGRGRAPELEVPGHRIPEVYLQYVEQRDPALLWAIVRHNARDLTAMATLWRWLAERRRSGEPEASGGGWSGGE